MRQTARQDLLEIYHAGLAAADPIKAVCRHVSLHETFLTIGKRTYDLRLHKRLFLLGAGKAAGGMALALEQILGEYITAGWVTVKSRPELSLKRTVLQEGGHPVPTTESLAGAREIARIAQAADEHDLVLFCLGGGASALMPMPVEGVSLADKQTLTALLLGSGANIREINCVRKHLSQLKGGQLARLARPAKLAALIFSDVIDDPLDVIGSGPTAPDETSFEQALMVLEKYHLTDHAPSNTLAYLRAGAAGKRPETPKPGDDVFAHVNNVLVGNNRTAAEAAAEKARSLGYDALIRTTSLEGEARSVALEQVDFARKVIRHTPPAHPPACIISGGETTVTLMGNGKGGRAQEFALAAAIAASGEESFALLAAGTDGADGPTDAAGAFCDGGTIHRAKQKGLDASDYLARNDAYHFFDSLGDLLRTGATGTNVMDLYLILCGLA